MSPFVSVSILSLSDALFFVLSIPFSHVQGLSPYLSITVFKSRLYSKFSTLGSPLPEENIVLSKIVSQNQSKSTSHDFDE